jgi:hypothetical protein
VEDCFAESFWNVVEHAHFSIEGYGPGVVQTGKRREDRVQKIGTLVGVVIRSREDHSDEKITHHEVGWSPLRTHPINVRGGRISDWEESQMLAALSR